jgi:hypothetical protein
MFNNVFPSALLRFFSVVLLVCLYPALVFVNPSLKFGELSTQTRKLSYIDKPFHRSLQPFSKFDFCLPTEHLPGL